MPSFFDHWFGIQDATRPALQEHTLQITDGDLVADFAVYDCNYGVGQCVPVPDNIASGWALVGPDAWQMQSAAFKGGGYYANSMLAHGQILRHAVFDNVTESFRTHLKTYSPDGMIQEVDILEELLLRRAPRYWTKRREYSPVYITRALPGESNLAYALLSQGSVLKPQNLWSAQCTMETGLLKPVLVSFIRQPFWLGAAPGQTQSTVEVSALQNWEFQMGWEVEDTTPAGYTYSFVETATGVIYASGFNEILQWAGVSWAAVSTAPVTLAESVTSSVLLNNGDILFGGVGRIIKRTSDGNWEIETTLPNGQVNAMILTNTGVIYAGDNGRILKRDADTEAWSVDTTLPLGFTYSFVQASDGNVFAGEVGRILRTTLSGGYGPEIDFSRYSLTSSAGSYNDAAETADGVVAARREPDVLFSSSAYWVGFRFQNITVPPGAVIRSARMRFRSTSGESETGGQMRIYGQRATNPGPFVDSTSQTVGGDISTTISINGDLSFVTLFPVPGQVLSGNWRDGNGDLTLDISSGGNVTGTISGRGSATFPFPTSGSQVHDWRMSYSGDVSGTLSGNDITGTITWDGSFFAENIADISFEGSGIFSLSISGSDVVGTINLQGEPTAPILASGTLSGSGTVSGTYTEDTVSAGLRTISGRPRTTASVLWTMNDAWLVTQDWRYESPDLTDVLQEIVNQSGWASGNAVVFILRYLASSRRRIDNHAYLDVTYVVVSPEETVWEVNTTLPTGNVRSLLESSISDLLLAGEDGRILASDDLGETWGVNSTLPTNETRALYEAVGFTYAGDNGNILRSPDGGRTWVQQDTTTATNYVEAFHYEIATQDMRAGDNGNILWMDETEQVTLGMEETTMDDIFVVNHHKECNLTNILRANAGGTVYGSNIFPMTVFTVALWPDPPVDNDAIYFGVDASTTDSGPFCNLIFDIAEVARGTFTVNWEYYNGGWVALNVQDETNGFREPGVHGVFWEHPTDWDNTGSVGGTAGYWVRARLSGTAADITVPTQQNRTVYSCITPFVNVNRLQLGGNVDPIVQMQLHSRADEGGPGGSAPMLYVNRAWVGAKETDGHENFRAYINLGNEQNAEGITIDVSNATWDPDGTTTLVDDTTFQSATDRMAFFDAGVAGANSWDDRLGIVFDTTVARDYYGTYMPILVLDQVAGNTETVSVRLKVISGSGGINKIGDTQTIQSLHSREILVFDSPITIPVSTQMTDTDIGDETIIVIQMIASDGTADVNLYGLFLQPVDGPWLECEDTANTDESSLEEGRQLLVDSISIPKSPTRAVVQNKATNAFVSTWHYDGNGEARLICRENQKLWFHFARTYEKASPIWLSDPEACCSVTLKMTNRYLFGIGGGA